LTIKTAPNSAPFRRESDALSVLVFVYRIASVIIDVEVHPIEADLHRVLVDGFKGLLGDANRLAFRADLSTARNINTLI
jgi:hypothetical protein